MLEKERRMQTEARKVSFLCAWTPAALFSLYIIFEVCALTLSAPLILLAQYQTLGLLH